MLGLDHGDASSAGAGGAGADDGHLLVIAEVLANAGQILDDGNVELLQVVGRTDTAEHQDLRGVECAAGDDDLASGAGGHLGSGGVGNLAVVRCVERLAHEILDAGGTGLAAAALGGGVEEDLCRQRGDRDG